jgi:trimethylamine-N-oxide reductase (cytochrome c)
MRNNLERLKGGTMKTRDKTITKSLSWFGGPMGGMAGHVDIMDDRIVRIRSLHFSEYYTEEDLGNWKIEKDGKVFEPTDKVLLSPLSFAYKKRADSPNRIPYPLIREDWSPENRNPQTRGFSKYRRISWDEATSIIASEIERIHETYGPRSIFTQGSGHGEAKAYSGAHGCHTKLFQLADGCTVQSRQPDSWEGWWWGGKHIWGMEPRGSNLFQTNCFKDVTENGDAVLFWGCDPETAPWGQHGQMASRICKWFNDIGVLSIYICPDVNYGAAIYADKWIPVLPNTDSALQLGIAHTWITEDTFDKNYLDKYTVGFDIFRDYVLGKDDGVPKSAAWASKKCGVPDYKIKALARYWATHAVSIAHCFGGSFIRAAYSHEPARLEIVLLVMQAFGKAGAHQLILCDLGTTGALGNMLPPAANDPSVHAGTHGWDMNVGDSFVIQTKVPEAILNNYASWYSPAIYIASRETQFDYYEYPRKGEAGIRMIWSDAPCWSTCWNNGGLFIDALRQDRIELIVVQHPWLENDCRFADIILPITTTFENEDYSVDLSNAQHPLFFFEKKAIEPFREARSDYEAALSVFKKLDKPESVYEGVVEKFTRGMNYEEWAKYTWEHSDIRESKYTFEELFNSDDMFWASPTMEDWEDLPVGIEYFLSDPEGFPLHTPTGLFEIYSQTLAEKFPDDEVRGPFPKWIEEGDGHYERISSKRAEKYPFLVVSNHPHWRHHAQHDDLPWLREIETCKVVGPDGYSYEPLWINPNDAKKLGLENGDIAKMFNERGAVLGGVRVTERIMPGVVYQDHGARVDPIVAGSGGLDRGGANNLICPDAVTSKNCGGEVTSAFLVGVEKVDVFELAKQYPEEFSRPYDPAFGLRVDSMIIEEG